MKIRKKPVVFLKIAKKTDIHALGEQPQPNPSFHRSGFTLMEVALAVSVVVIGLMALFSLISVGLSSGTRAVQDTQAAIFADNVFNGLRAMSQEEASYGINGAGEDSWRRFWIDFAGAKDSISVAASNNWETSAALEIRANEYKKGSRGQAGGYDSTLQKLRFENLSQHGVTDIDPLINHALRFRLEVRPEDITTKSGWVSTLENTNLSVTLYVWLGEFGSTNDPIIFYSEFNNPGDL